MKNKKVIFAIVLFVFGLACFIVNAKFEITALLPALALFAVGFFLLIKGGDWFVDGASAIAEKFKVTYKAEYSDKCLINFSVKKSDYDAFIKAIKK